MNYKDTKLIQFLSSFSKEEFDEFDKFLKSPFFKKGRDPHPLLKILYKHKDDLSSEDLSEKQIFGELYPDSDHKDKNTKALFRNMSSSLLKAVEEFLYISNLKKNNVLKNRLLLNEILERNLTKHYKQYLEQAEKDIKDKEEFYGFDTIEKYHLERLNSRFHSVTLDMEKYFRHGFYAFEHLSYIYWFELINSAKLQMFSADNLNIKFKNDIIENAMNAVDMNKIIDSFKGTVYHTYLYFYYNLYMHLKDINNMKYYENAKKIFFDNKSEISPYDKIYFYTDLLSVFNFGVSNNAHLKRDELNLIKACLEDRAYKVSDSDFMHPNFYRNTVICADYLKEHEWADSFIEKYHKELKPEFRENMKFYGKALIYYGKGDYEEALNYISKVKYEMVYFKTDVKTLMLRLFYELKLYDQAFSMIDTLKHHIKKSSLMDDDKRNAFLKYLNYYLKLLKLQTPDRSGRKNEAAILIKQISNEKHMFQTQWLIQKLKEI